MSVAGFATTRHLLRYTAVANDIAIGIAVENEETRPEHAPTADSSDGDRKGRLDGVRLD